MSFLDYAAKSLPVVTNPFALAAYLVAALVWAFVAVKTAEIKSEQKKVKSLGPEKAYEWLRVIHDGIPTPDTLPPEKWLAARRQRYYFAGFAALLVVFFVLVLTFILKPPSFIPPGPPTDDSRMADLRNEEKLLNKLYEQWVNNPSPSAKNLLSSEILTKAPALLERYQAIEESSLKSPKFTIERFQRIAALSFYQARILLLQKDSSNATAHAKEAVMYAESGLEAGNKLKSLRSADATTTDALHYYLTDPPTEEQVLRWYYAAGLAVIAASGGNTNPANNQPIQPELEKAKAEIKDLFPVDDEPFVDSPDSAANHKT